MKTRLNITPQNSTASGVRDISMDLLRVFASVLVVLIHVSSQNWYGTSIYSADWQAMNIFDSIARPAVPIFLMLSGAFMLAPEKPLTARRILLRYIPRLMGAYVLWSFVYAVYSLTSAFTAFSGLSFISIIKATVDGQYHLWYLPVIILLYILLPVLRPAVAGDDGRRRCEYMLAVFLAYGAVRTTVLVFDFPGHSYAQTLADRFTFGALWSYAGYFILGYYLYRYTLSKTFKFAVYTLGLCAVPLTAAATYAVSLHTGAPDERFYTIFSAITVFYAAALFIFFKEIISKIKFSTSTSRIIGFIGSCSLLVYLVHVLLLNLICDRLDISTATGPAALMIPALTAVVYLGSLAFACIYKLILGLLKSASVH
jgi:Uncharacterized protein conserved in bacteria